MTAMGMSLPGATLFLLGTTETLTRELESANWACTADVGTMVGSESKANAKAASACCIRLRSNLRVRRVRRVRRARQFDADDFDSNCGSCEA